MLDMHGGDIPTAVLCAFQVQPSRNRLISRVPLELIRSKPTLNLNLDSGIEGLAHNYQDTCTEDVTNAWYDICKYQNKLKD